MFTFAVLMEQVQLHDKHFTLKYPAAELDERIRLVAGQITHDYMGRKPIFLVVLNGAFMFAAGLIRNVCLDCEVSFVKLASYHGTSSSGKVVGLIGLTEDLSGRDVILVEDIVDTGTTLEHLLHEVGKQAPASVTIATLLYKPEAYKKHFPIDYVGLEVPNEFLVGFGLDYDGLGRNLSAIYTLSASE
jgi:hypoxanthine phosphoribosyltransferase